MEQAAAQRTLMLVPFRIDESWLAVEAELVREILSGQPWIPIPGASAALPGVTAWRGRAIAVLDIAAATGVGQPLTPDTGLPRLMVLEVDGCTAALPVDSVREVFPLAEEEISTSNAADNPVLLSREAHVGDDVILLLDVQTMFKDLTKKGRA